MSSLADRRRDRQDRYYAFGRFYLSALIACQIGLVAYFGAVFALSGACWDLALALYLGYRIVATIDRMRRLCRS